MLKHIVGAFLLVALVACSKNSSENSIDSSAPKTQSAEPAEVDRSATLNQLTQALRKFAAEQRRVPKDLNELVTAGYLPELPAAPAGKKYVFDDQLRVMLK
jgi:hypothetical protein